jgi:hypothetical protein
LSAGVGAGSGLQEVFAPADLLNALNFCDRHPGRPQQLRGLPGGAQVLLSMLTMAKGSQRFD